MIDRRQLLTDLQRLLGTLEGDLLERGESSDLPEVGRTLRVVFDLARQAERTAQTFEEWRSDQITQVAAAWVLSAVFARFLEDNRLVEPPKLAGPGERMRRARDEHELFFRSQPKLNDRDYLLAAFAELAALPGAEQIFGPRNAIHEVPNWLSGDAAGELLRFFQRIDAETGNLRHDFSDPLWDTRFLGDLYQDLSEAARKKYALLQTPEFIEEFILDRTLEPAIEEFGLAAAGNKEPTTSDFRLIDPACGSGHFVLGAFRRILDRWQRREPGAKARVLAQRALDGVYGVDVNPYAVAIARFRLLLAAMRACGVARLADAPAFRLNLVCGDSLLHGAGEQQSFGWRDVDHATYAEDLAELRRILVPGRYHAVVANPPYITPKDRALNQAYRDRYTTCHMKYSLAVPFMERIFRLAVPGGFTGQITANSFMKREFGKKLIEEFLPTIDLTHVIDTSLAYIPGHGTPTVILFGRHRAPIASTLRCVGSIKRENEEPQIPEKGKVWSAIVDQMDQAGTQSEFVSVNDSPRENFHKHPWSIGGGGAAELKEQLDECAPARLGALAAALGITAVTGEDELFMQPATVLRRTRIELQRQLVEGEIVRDWAIGAPMSSAWMYDDDFKLIPLESLHQTARLYWCFRSSIRWRKRFGTPLVERGLTWYEWQELYKDKLRTPLSIVFAFVATHNHFVLDRGGKVFNRSAPIIKLPPDATEHEHL
ncbi:MAG TPA: BREX-2 system adenine-specific DNA-methyltransferase PglX, partial [Pirellulales bacterium]|nr:BREX-2 system adenine-specific DNA-methyltransferase PglX [Pirellulales bacterium]